MEYSESLCNQNIRKLMHMNPDLAIGGNEGQLKSFSPRKILLLSSPTKIFVKHFSFKILKPTTTTTTTKTKKIEQNPSWTSAPVVLGDM